MRSEDYFKDQYFYELNRRDRLTRDLSLPFAIFVILSGAFLWLTIRLSTPLSSLDGALIILLVAILLQLCAISVVFWRVWAENPYKYPATADEIHDYASSLREHYANISARKHKSDARKAFHQFLIDEYVRCGSHNAKINDQRAKRLNWLKRLTLVTGIFTLIAFLIDTANQIISQP